MNNCKGCIERRLGCHSVCETYIKWKKNLDEVNKKKRTLSTYDWIASKRGRR